MILRYNSIFDVIKMKTTCKNIHNERKDKVYSLLRGKFHNLSGPSVITNGCSFWYINESEIFGKHLLKLARLNGMIV